MKENVYAVLILGIFIFVFSMSAAQAQEETKPDFVPPKPNTEQKKRPNLLAELNLTPAQIDQIRVINQENKLKRREAHQRVFEAQKSLDEAVYSDSLNEPELQNRLKNLQLAQAEVIKLRIMTEYAVRKVLTPEQLVRFRDLRQNFMNGAANRRRQPRDRPFANPEKPFNNRQRRLRPNN